MNKENPQSSLFDNHMGFNRETDSYHSQPFSSNTSDSSSQRTILVVDDQDGDDDDYESDDLEASLGGDCVYSKPFLFLDMMWNLAFVVASFCVLLTTVKEKPSTPLRLWICGYALQCLLHVVCAWDEYQRRSLDYALDGGGGGGFQGFYFRRVFSFSAFCHNSIMKKLESINTIVSSIWWVLGFYWIISGGEELIQESPRLYWLSVVYLAFDVFFMFFCVAMACLVFFLLFCCFPILATVAYAMTVQEGASENDIRSLPKLLYRRQNNDVNTTTLVSNAELVLDTDDSECCICLYKYVDGVQLCKLPCNHHFHHKCVTKWLRINARCPLCKLDVRKGESLV